jgi:DNA-binding transcriptional MerR regulator
MHREPTNVSFISPITVVRTGRRGRPRKVIDDSYLQEAMSAQRRISISKLARALGVHRHTVRHYLKEANINTQFSTLSPGELDTLVRHFQESKPDSGIRYVIGSLRDNGLRIQRSRVIDSVHRVDPVGTALREHTTIHRRQYTVSRPNALWHIDGHHKLIRWGIVIHGIIDGYCRTVCVFSDMNLTLLIIGKRSQVFVQAPTIGRQQF